MFSFMKHMSEQETPNMLLAGKVRPSSLLTKQHAEFFFGEAAATKCLLPIFISKTISTKVKDGTK